MGRGWRGGGRGRRGSPYRLNAIFSLALLMGLGGNYLLGFWQADPLAGLVIAAFLFREGVQTWGEAGEAEDEGGEGPRTA